MSLYMYDSETVIVPVLKRRSSSAFTSAVSHVLYDDEDQESRARHTSKERTRLQIKRKVILLNITLLHAS